jgi:hypothetical protein
LGEADCFQGRQHQPDGQPVFIHINLPHGPFFEQGNTYQILAMRSSLPQGDILDHF